MVYLLLRSELLQLLGFVVSRQEWDCALVAINTLSSNKEAVFSLCLLEDYTKTTRLFFIKFGGKVAHGPRRHRYILSVIQICI